MRGYIETCSENNLVNICLQSTIQPAGSVTFEHRNLQGLNRSILGCVTSNNLLNPQVHF